MQLRKCPGVCCPERNDGSTGETTWRETIFIADIACFPWVRIHKMANQSLDDLPLVTRWYTAIRSWPAVERGLPSRYLWVGTDRYRSSKFVRDGAFNLEWSMASSAAPGCCAR